MKKDDECNDIHGQASGREFLYAHHGLAVAHRHAVQLYVE